VRVSRGVVCVVDISATLRPGTPRRRPIFGPADVFSIGIPGVAERTAASTVPERRPCLLVLRVTVLRETRGVPTP
jgi:hypothetical protein